VNFQAIMKACLFDLQILSDELELAAQGDPRSPAVEGLMRSKSAEADSADGSRMRRLPCIRIPMWVRLLNKKCGM